MLSFALHGLPSWLYVFVLANTKEDESSEPGHNVPLTKLRKRGNGTKSNSPQGRSDGWNRKARTPKQPEGVCTEAHNVHEEPRQHASKNSLRC